jgi:hypothetical protein
MWTHRRHALMHHSNHAYRHILPNIKLELRIKLQKALVIMYVDIKISIQMHTHKTYTLSRTLLRASSQA